MDSVGIKKNNKNTCLTYFGKSLIGVRLLGVSESKQRCWTTSGWTDERTVDSAA